MRVLATILVALIVSGILMGCVSESISTNTDEKGWHCKFNSATGVRDIAYPVKKGMNVTFVANVSSGSLLTALTLNGKLVFYKWFNKSGERGVVNCTVNYTIPETGVCIVKIYIKNATGNFDFLI